VADAIVAEAARLEWLAGHLPVPEVRRFVGTPGDAYLVTTAVPGRSAYHCLLEEPTRRSEIVAALAAFLRRVHALPLANCPFDGRVTGCIDVGRAGAADRYQDLAMLWNCLADFGGELQRELFHAYGTGEPDARRLRFHLCLDEFF
jgi:aminoglycoside phosphotransferase